MNSPQVLFPAESLKGHIAILGKTGSGKSNTAKVLAEFQMALDERVCIIDPTGTWWGLRLDKRGTKPSKFKPVIFGGLHGDLVISEQHGAVLGETIGTSSGSSIIDTQQMTVGQRTRFFAAFAEALIRFNRGKLTLIVDEAHLFAPQGKVNDPQSGAMLHAANNLVATGRSRGINVVLISQRPAKLHKDSLTQVETMIAMRVIAPQDRAAVKDWVGDWAEGDKGAEIIASLPSLPVGVGWLWCPVISYLDRKQFPLASTFDSGTPEANADVRTLVPIDLAAMGDKMDAIRQQAMENDPKRLRKIIEELKAHPAQIVDPGAETRGYDAGYKHGEAAGRLAGMGLVAKQVIDLAGSLATQIGAIQPEEKAKEPAPPPNNREEIAPGLYRIPASAPDASRETFDRHPMSPSSIKLVDAIVAAYPATMTLETAAKRAGLSKRSSAFGRYLREAASSHRIQAVGVDNRYRATAPEHGVQAPAGLDAFKRALPPSYGRMLDALEKATAPMDAGEVADASGVSRTSSGLSAGLKELVALGLAEIHGGAYRLSEDFR